MWNKTTKSCLNCINLNKYYEDDFYQWIHVASYECKVTTFDNLSTFPFKKTKCKKHKTK